MTVIQDLAELQDDARGKFVVRYGTRLHDFLTSSAPVDILLGPLGSGKTKALCARIMRHAQEQAPSPKDGLRYTRFALVRNTYPDLRRTTIRSWLELFPEHLYGRFNWGQPINHAISFDTVRLEVDFLALDRPEDVPRLRSTEYTGIAFNELSFIPKDLFDEADSRLRYPPPEHGGPTWRGVIADTNAADEDHWLPIMTGDVDLPPGLTEDEIAALTWPNEWRLHRQPAALIEKMDQHGIVSGYGINVSAENLENLPKDYYQRMLRGKSKAWIDSRLMVRVVLVTEGQPVWPMFRREVHVSSEVLRPRLEYDVYVGLDFGRSPAAIFMQEINNRIFAQYELIGANEGASLFAPKVARFLDKNYPNCTVHAYGDPKGRDKTQTDERTAYEVFAHNGITVRPPPGLKQNMIATRVDAGASLLNEMVDGKPRFQSSPLCRTFNVGMAGRYHNERDEYGELKPCKNRFSHVCEGWQYGILGMGEGRRMIGRPRVGDFRGIRVARQHKSMRRIVA
jgi:hypothetical protein